MIPNKNFFKLLEARAYKVAKERLDEKITKSDPNSPEKLPHEKDFFIPIDNSLNLIFPENFEKNKFDY